MENTTVIHTFKPKNKDLYKSNPNHVSIEIAENGFVSTVFFDDNREVKRISNDLVSLISYIRTILDRQV